MRCADRLGFEGIVKGSHYSAHPFESLQQIPFLAHCAVYVLQRKDPPVLVYERDGTFVGSWGTGEIADPHGLKITGDVVYTTDRTGSVAKSFTLEGKLLLELGQRGVYSDTGCTGAPWLAVQASGPFNHPTEMNAHPNGDIYVTNGYRNARVHRFSAGGTLKTSWGAPGSGPGEFHLPHCVVFDESGRLYVADRANRRIQIFSPDGAYLDKWTSMGGPNDIARGADGIFYVAEQEHDRKPAYVCVRDAAGAVLTRLESRHVHGVGVDSRGGIYAGLTVDRGVDKFVRKS